MPTVIPTSPKYNLQISRPLLCA